MYWYKVYNEQHCIKVHEYSTFISGKSVSLSLLMVKLNKNSYLGHMAIPIIMKKLYEGEGRGSSRFLLAHIPEISWISCGNSEIS
jgi:hypothetical protein